MRRGDGFEALARVDGAPALQVEHPHRVRVLRIGVGVHVVPRPAAQIGVVAQALPRVAIVIRAKHGAVFGFDQRPHAAGLRRRRGDANSAEQPRRQTLVAGQLRPGVAPVQAAPDAGVRTAALGRVRKPPSLPDGRVQHARVADVQGQVGGAGVLGLVQHQVPGRAAVLRAVYAALGVGAPGVTHGGDVHHVRIGRVDGDAADVARRRQSNVSPGPASIIRAIHAVAVRYVAADAGFAGAGIDDVRVGVRDGDCANRGRVEVAVGDVDPVRAAVGRLEHTAGAGAEVERAGVGRVSGHGHASPAAVRPNVAPLERPEEAVVDHPF